MDYYYINGIKKWVKKANTVEEICEQIQNDNNNPNIDDFKLLDIKKLISRIKEHETKIESISNELSIIKTQLTSNEKTQKGRNDFTTLANQFIKEQRQKDPKGMMDGKDTLSFKVYPFVTYNFREFCKKYYPSQSVGDVMSGIIISAILEEDEEILQLNT